MKIICITQLTFGIERSKCCFLLPIEDYKIKSSSRDNPPPPKKEGNSETFYNMKLEDIGLSELKQSQKHKYYIIPHTSVI